MLKCLDASYYQWLNLNKRAINLNMAMQLYQPRKGLNSLRLARTFSLATRHVHLRQRLPRVQQIGSSSRL